MSPLSLPIILFAFLASFFYILFAAVSSKNHHNNGRKLPPGPPSIPIIGNLHMLGKLPHRTLHHLAKKYGSIMSMKLGNVTAIIVSSPQAAKIFLRTHDSVFASRPKLQATRYLYFGSVGLGFAEYGPYWRYVKKLCTSQLLSASKIEAFGPMIREEIGLLVDKLKIAATSNEQVDFTMILGDSIQNMTFRMVFGVANNNDRDIEMKSAIEEYMSLIGAFNMEDFVPCLRPFDLQGLKKRMKACNKEMGKVIDKIMVEHEKENRWVSKEQRDFIDVLLSLINQSMDSNDEALVHQLDRTNIKDILLDMVVGSFDTSTTAIEWTIVELLRHPQAMKRLQDELQNVTGLNKMVEEKDLQNLTYLDLVIMESLRLHPNAPLLAPHESMEEMTINGYHIPKKSRIIVNVWAIGRDSDVWSGNVDEFLPERFIGTNIDLRRHDFQLIPFGSGRRRCPGMLLALTVVRIVVAQLVHCFNWELPNGVLPSELDMSEKFGLTVSRASHLVVVPKYRLLV